MKQATILVIHTAEPSRTALRLVLEQHGFAVKEAMDIETGLPIARECRPSVVFLPGDPEMLGADGPLARLRAEPLMDGVAAVAILIDPASVGSPQYRRAGFAAYVRKPFDLRRIPEVVIACLPVGDADPLPPMVVA
jgi:DNA-binding response OmpR family regulator